MWLVLLCETGMMPASEAVPTDDDPPPFLKSWQQVYWAVVVYLAIVIIALYFVSGLFSY